MEENNDHRQRIIKHGLLGGVAHLRAAPILGDVFNEHIHPRANAIRDVPGHVRWNSMLRNCSGKWPLPVFL
eukprot:11158046-Lingulodinium_polyedra.AAC.1